MVEKLNTQKNLQKTILHGIRIALLQLGSATKADLSQRLGISFPTVSKFIFQMEKNKEVFAVGLDESSGGRRAQRYAYNPEHMLGLAIFLERDETIYTIFNCLGEVKETSSHKSILQEGLNSLIELTGEIIDRFPKISGISFGVPGSVENGRIFFIPDYDEFQNLDLQRTFEEFFSLPVVVENDMNAAVLGFHDRTGKDNDQSIVYIYSGKNGAGAGLLINGKVVRGSSFFSGEISFVPLFDKQNFHQAITDNKNSTEFEKIDAISRLIASLTAIINPHEVIFNKDEINPLKLEHLKKGSSKYVPNEHLPILKVSDWREDYLHGLKYLLLERMLRL